MPNSEPQATGRKPKAGRKRVFWRLCRIYFRRFRITVWLLLLLSLGGLIYLDQVGLPEFVKKPLLVELRARGLDLRFTRLRLSWTEGLVADQVRFGRTDEPWGPHLDLDKVQVRLDYSALARRRLAVDALTLRHGRLVWPIPEGERSRRELSVEDIQTDLRFLPDDRWALDNFTARFSGVNLRLSGVVDHASAVQKWKFLQSEGAPPTPAAVWQRRLSRFADTLEKIEFSGTPDLRLKIRGDALDLLSFGVQLDVSAPGARTPWGAVSQGRFSAKLSPANSNGTSHAELSLAALEAQSRWADITNFQLLIKLDSLEGQTNLVQGELDLSAREVHTEWAVSSGARLNARWIHSITNPIPLAGQGRFRCDAAQTQWGRGRGLDLTGEMQRRAPDLSRPPDPSLGWWTNLEPYVVKWDGRLKELTTPQVEAADLASAGAWQFPNLTLTNLSAKLYGGSIRSGGSLEILTRQARANLTSDFDVQKVTPLLPETVRRFLQRLAWNEPPKLEGEVGVVLPAWTDREPDWGKEVLPTLVLRGQFNVERGGTYLGLPASSARSHFSYVKRVWHLPDLEVIRPEGKVNAEHVSDEIRHENYWRIASTIDPWVVRPLLSESGLAGLSLITLTEPPRIEAEIWDHGQDEKRIGFKGRLALTNFTFRGESISGLQTDLQYSNLFFHALGPRVQCGARQGSAEGVGIDLKAGFVYLTNAVSNLDPMVVTRAIGPKTARAIEAYQFAVPPQGRVYGTISLHGEEGTDLHFELAGGPFHWWKFNLPHISGQVHWSGKNLSLKNIQADFYGGQAAGEAYFNFAVPKGTEFEFSAFITNSLLQHLMGDLTARTNQPEGRVSGRVVITKANTEGWQNTQGYGDMNLKDGLIWDIPMFGIFTPVLDSISPGLGRSRAKSGTCTFVMTRGVLNTTDLEMRASGMRLQYRGSVDLESQVNARVEAELLRDVWLVGPVVSTVFWPVTKLFEYKVTGTLGEPKLEPLFVIPKIVLMPFQPFRALKQLFPSNDPNETRNPPPNFSPLPP
jgi:hypothetical protein